MNSLLPCPFCGFKNIYILIAQSLRIKIRAQCLNCKCRTKQFHTEEEAIDAWNRRASQDMPEKYKLLLEFVTWFSKSGCSMIDGMECKPCKAKEVLNKIGDK